MGQVQVHLKILAGFLQKKAPFAFAWISNDVVRKNLHSEQSNDESV